MEQTGLTMQEGTTSFSNLQRGTTLMRSRLLSTAAALFLLLGLVSTSAFAQISSSASVNFFIRTYDNATTPALVSNWHATTATTDTVGHKFDAIAQWITAGQALGSVSYTVTFPKGTVLETAAADSVFLRFYTGAYTELAQGTPQEIEVSSSNVVVNANPESAYSATAVPSITVTDGTILSSETTVQIVVYAGLKIGSLVANVNNSAQDYMKWTLRSSTQASTVFSDSSSLRALPDRVDGVVFNTAIAAYIDGPAKSFPAADTIIFVDRFGNKRPFNAAADSIQISVPTGAGWWNIDSADTKNSTLTAMADGNLKYPTATDSTTILIKALNSYVAGVYGNNTGFLHDSTGVTYPYTMMLLGSDKTGATINTGGLGLAFDGVATQDSTTFTVTVKGPNVASGTLLGVAADGVSSIRRARLADAASKQIGSLSLTWANNGTNPTYVGGKLDGSLTITIKNIFGANFAANSVIGTDTDPVAYRFLYIDSLEAVDATKTGYLTSGKQVNSIYSMPATTLNYFTAAQVTANKDSIDGSNFKLVLDASSKAYLTAAKGNQPIYYGMASNSVKKDSIAVVVYAVNDPTKIDTFKINVNPGSPVAFDLDTLKANLATAIAAGQIVKGAQFPISLPMVALDTAYNQVTSLVTGSASTDLEAIAVNVSGTTVKGIQFKIDGRDPLGYDSAAIPDSIRIDSTYQTKATSPDSSYLNDYTSSTGTIDLGSTGIGMRLQYLGINHVLSMVWDPAQVGSGWNPGKDSLDIGLFTLVDTTAIDSAQSVTIVSSTHRAGRVDTMDISFVLPVGNTVDQNSADSLIFVKFDSLAGPAGLPVGLTKENVQVSLDAGVNWYNALGVSAITSEDEDSVWLATPITLNAASTAKTVRVRFLNFVNPTKANIDTAGIYGLKVKTEATPVLARASAAAVQDKFVADTTASLLIVAANDTLKDTYPRWTSDVVNLTDAVAVKADMTTMIKLLRVDQYGNIVEEAAGNVGGTAKTLKITSLDSTALGASLTAKQTFANVVSNSAAGTNGIDYLSVKTDDVGTEGSYADSIAITPEVSNGGVSYYIVIADSINATAKDSFLVAVYNTVASTITVDPDSNMAGARGSALPTLSVTLKDTLGNVVTDSLISYGLVFGDVTGAFSDTNGTALVAGVDTVSASTGSDGIATAIFTAGQMDSVAIKVWAANSGVAVKYFTASLSVVGDTMLFSVISPADSLVPNITTAKTITANVTDANDVTKVWANVWRSELVLNAENKFDISEAVAYDHAVEVVIATPTDSVQVALLLPDSTVAVDTAAVIRYQLVGVDALDDTTYSDTMMYVVAPKRGKRNMTANKVNVADVMRLVYLIAIDEIVPTDIDYMGLDLDQDGLFATSDLTAELAIWKGTGTMLAGAVSLENATAKSSLSYVATDKKTANLALNLESSHNMVMSCFQDQV